LEVSSLIPLERIKGQPNAKFTVWNFVYGYLSCKWGFGFVTKREFPLIQHPGDTFCDLSNMVEFKAIKQKNTKKDFSS
jgi:hypothetical protein